MKILELFFKSGEVTGLGLLAVIAIIAVIFAVIKMLGSSLGSGKKAAKKEAPKAEVVQAEQEPEPVPAAPAAQDDSELIAVLAAAVSAYCGEPVTKFRVVSFKHIK
ncbi:MAG: OadG family protein [Clostridia bacterium]|nr:OadG family protein [Clostridia bacterium]